VVVVKGYLLLELNLLISLDLFVVLMFEILVLAFTVLMPFVELLLVYSNLLLLFEANFLAVLLLLFMGWNRMLLVI
jgi:hypothetical protein